MQNSKKFEASFDSLKKFECPAWFQDAKFGIWSHWGPQSVPMYGDWYARNMYVQGSAQYKYHVRHYGHPSEFGYKDLCALWKADKFDPEYLMELYVKAGAKYFVAQAMHHDNFFNFPSTYNRFNSMEVGPGKDICGLWKKAADKFNVPFGLTEHLGASFSWWFTNKGSDSYGPYAGIPYDGNDPAYRDFYHDNYEHILKEKPAVNGNDLWMPCAVWYTKKPEFQEYWLKVMKELIDQYQPDLLYSDGGLPFADANEAQPEHPQYTKGLEAVSYLYNTSIQKYGENRAVYNQKDRRTEIYPIGILDIEKSQLPGIRPEPWQTDTCIGNWFYDVRQDFKRPEHIIEMLVDIISKNGNMLLNILQLPDGSIDAETLYILEELASWFEVCSEGVYGSRPWRTYKEGDTSVVIDGFKEDKTEWNASDFRFTAKENTIYAFLLAAPENRITVIKSLLPEEQVRSVRLLGFGEVEFAQNFGILTVKLPEKLPTKYTNCLAIEL